MEGLIVLTPIVIIIFAITGWCGTVPRRPFPLPPGPDPDPDPIYWPTRIAGALGGILGGWLVSASGASVTGAGLLTAMIGAFLGGCFLADVAGAVMPRGR